MPSIIIKNCCWKISACLRIDKKWGLRSILCKNWSATPGFPNLFSQRKYATHYDILGLSKNAKASDIKEAYIKKTKEHHPDAGQSDNVDTFLKIAEAYEVLSNPSTRRQYDFQKFGRSSDWNRFRTGEYNIPENDPDFNRAVRYREKRSSNSTSKAGPLPDEPIKMALSSNARVILDYLLAALITICISMYLLSRYQRQKREQSKDEID